MTSVLLTSIRHNLYTVNRVARPFCKGCCPNLEAPHGPRVCWLAKGWTTFFLALSRNTEIAALRTLKCYRYLDRLFLTCTAQREDIGLLDLCRWLLRLLCGEIATEIRVRMKL
jgi:hypothetical protein